MSPIARLLSAVVPATLAGLALPAAALAAGEGAPAGGAETTQIVIATGAAGVLVTGLLVLGLGHRSGRLGVLGGLGRFSTRLSGLPGWAALPAGVATGGLLLAVFGLYWDVSLHIDNGRDAGPLANPSHYFILAGLFGVFAAGWLAMVLPAERPGPAALRITGEWYAPVSGVLLMACASFALLGFPLDDVSHRLFGQDVTLWGPTHLMMLGGAAMILIGILGLLTEGRLALRGTPPAAPAGDAVPALSGPRARTVRLVLACGGLLTGLSIFQGEFDFGVPQFRLLFHPALLALAAGVALVAARTLGGRGAALGAAAFFIVLRGVLTLVVGPVLGQSTAHFPLFVAEALLVEAAALAVIPRQRPWRFAFAAGGLVGTVGVLAEWAWSQVWMPIAWPAALLPEAVVVGLPMAVAGAVLGAFLAGAIRLAPFVGVGRRAAAAAGAALLVVAGVLTVLLPTRAPSGASARVALQQVSPAPQRSVHATVRFAPASVADGADWITSTAWQGQGLVVAPLRRVGEGVYRTTEPLPVHGSWKSMIRVHRGPEMATVPVYAPPDPAIPVSGIPALARFERPLVDDTKVLQRERKQDVAGWLWAAAGAVVLGLTLVLLLTLGWGLLRLARAGVAARGPEASGGEPAPEAPAPPRERVSAGMA